MQPYLAIFSISQNPLLVRPIDDWMEMRWRSEIWAEPQPPPFWVSLSVCLDDYSFLVGILLEVSGIVMRYPLTCSSQPPSPVWIMNAMFQAIRKCLSTKPGQSSFCTRAASIAQVVSGIFLKLWANLKDLKRPFAMMFALGDRAPLNPPPKRSKHVFLSAFVEMWRTLLSVKGFVSLLQKSSSFNYHLLSLAVRVPLNHTSHTRAEFDTESQVFGHR